MHTQIAPNHNTQPVNEFNLVMKYQKENCQRSFNTLLEKYRPFIENQTRKFHWKAANRYEAEDIKQLIIIEFIKLLRDIKEERVYAPETFCFASLLVLRVRTNVGWTIFGSKSAKTTPIPVEVIPEKQILDGSIAEVEENMILDQFEKVITPLQKKILTELRNRKRLAEIEKSCKISRYTIDQNIQDMRNKFTRF